MHMSIHDVLYGTSSNLDALEVAETLPIMYMYIVSVLFIEVYSCQLTSMYVYVYQQAYKHVGSHKNYVDSNSPLPAFSL